MAPATSASRRSRAQDRAADRRDHPGHLDRHLRLRPAPARGPGPVHRRGRHPRPRADGDRRGGRVRGGHRAQPSATAWSCRSTSPAATAGCASARSAVAVRDHPGSRAGNGRRAVRLHEAVRPGAGGPGGVPARAAGALRPDQGARRPAGRALPVPLRRPADRVAGGRVRRDVRTAAACWCSASGRSARWRRGSPHAPRRRARDRRRPRLGAAGDAPTRHGVHMLDVDEHADIAEAVRELTGGRGTDAVIDAVGMEAHGRPARRSPSGSPACCPTRRAPADGDGGRRPARARSTGDRDRLPRRDDLALRRLRRHRRPDQHAAAVRQAGEAEMGQAHVSAGSTT